MTVVQNSKDGLPLVYSCSGCSSAAQMANQLAVKLDKKGIAEMSCIAGVGGNVKKLLMIAHSGKKIIAIDGCPLACVKACLDNHSLKADLHFDLSGFGVKKILHEDFNQLQANQLFEIIQDEIGLEKKNASSGICYLEKPS